MINGFRAWDKVHKEMIDDIWIAPEYGWGVYSDNDWLGERKQLPRDSIILMQSIGVADGRGKNIYESDIVTRDHVKYGVVEYNTDREGGACWTVSNNIWFKDRWYNLEVVGDIYRNPELLKGEQHGKR